MSQSLTPGEVANHAGRHVRRALEDALMRTPNVARLDREHEDSPVMVARIAGLDVPVEVAIEVRGRVTGEQQEMTDVERALKRFDEGKQFGLARAAKAMSEILAEMVSEVDGKPHTPISYDEVFDRLQGFVIEFEQKS